MHKIFKVIILLCSLPTIVWAGMPTQRLGSYNIRFNSANDTGDISWNNRKTYVAKLIQQIDYDVVGLQEVTYVQYCDLLSLLPEYTIYSWGRGSATVSTAGEGVCVLYKTSRYTCLDQGRFFLGPDTEMPVRAWDAGLPRLSVWVKLQDKQSGEIFLFCSTHLDNTGSKSRIEAARVNCEQLLSKIAGNYPIILVGDMNAGQAEKGVHNQYGSVFSDSRNVSKTKPMGQEGTVSNWKLSNNSGRIDYIYVRNVDVEDYTLSNEDFSRGVTPSDHYPIYITARLLSTDRATSITVKNADELRHAIASSMLGDTIYMESEEYTLEDELTIPHSLTLIGMDNVSITGNRIHALPPANLCIENVSFSSNHSYDKSCFGSVINAEGYGLELKNCRVTNCLTDGKGIIYGVGRIKFSRCTFASLVSNEDAGPIYVSSNGYWPLTIEDCIFDGNQGILGSAIYITGLHDGFLARSSFVGNTSMMAGALTYYDSSTTPSILMVNCTFANNVHRSNSSFINMAYGGAAVYLMGTSNALCNLVHCTIVGNQAECLEADGSSGYGFTGGAICAYSGKLGLYNNIILANYASNSVGDVSITNASSIVKDQYNVFSSSSNSNFALSTSDFVSANYTTSLQQANRLFGESVSGQRYVAPIVGYAPNYLPVVVPICHTYNDMNLECITPDLRDENTLQLDLNNDGQIGGILMEDQIGDNRSVFGATMPGSMMEHQPTGIQPVESCKSMGASKILYNGVIWIEYKGNKYTIMGSVR